MRTGLFSPPISSASGGKERISPESAGDEDGWERKLMLGFLARARRGCLSTDLKSNYEHWGAFLFFLFRCQRGFWEMRDVWMYVCPCSPCFIDAPTPFWLIEAHVIPLTAFTPVCLCIRLPLTRCTSRPPTDPIVVSLASVERAGTLKECKAADQSGLERECTQRPPCEGFLSLSFFFSFLQQSTLLATLSCSQQAVVKDTSV